ncbi:hypothetical protein ScPMuIL_017300 [Solemya velum]
MNGVVTNGARRTKCAIGETLLAESGPYYFDDDGNSGLSSIAPPDSGDEQLFSCDGDEDVDDVSPSQKRDKWSMETEEKIVQFFYDQDHEVNKNEQKNALPAEFSVTIGDRPRQVEEYQEYEEQPSGEEADQETMQVNQPQADRLNRPTMVDPAFRSVTKGKTGFYIWRIENMNVVPVPREQYAKFYQGDSYIVLSVKDAKGALESHVHFWLGHETTQDEAGVAAYKSVELDDMLDGSPVQHREVEGSESKLFMNYFKPKGGIQYLKGGHASGFNHVEHVFQKRLVHIKGKQHVRIREVDMSWDSFNHGDAFILDLGTVLFVWLGKDCNRTERMKALEHSRHLRDERGLQGGKKVNIITVEDGEEDKMTEEEKKLFSSSLSLKDKSIKATEAAGDDAIVEKSSADIKLYVCSEDSDGTLKVSEVKSGPLSKKDLDSSDSYIIDNGAHGIWAWIGKGSSKNERKDAMRNAMGYLKKKELRQNTMVTRVIDGGEPSDFKALFRDWPQPPMPGKVYSRGRIAKTVQTKFDASTLHQNRKMAAETQMFDDGSGTVQAWRIKDFDWEPLPSNIIGEFHGGDCYVLLYTYEVNNKKNHVIYYWQGTKASADEKGTSALKAIELDDKMGGSPVQVRMIIYEGGHAGWGTNGGGSGGGNNNQCMLQVRGTSQLNTKAVEVDMDASSLNSNDVFVIFAKTQVFIWAGKGSTGDEREMAKIVAAKMPRDPIMVFEGQEKENFWEVLGGQKAYASDKRLQAQEKENVHLPRLFQVSNASGNIKCEEIPDFEQVDLVSDDIMLLDIWDCILVWIGEGANKQEKDAVEQLAFEYIKSDPSGRDEGTPVYKIKQGCEPPIFTGFFGAWDNDLWNKGKSFEELARELGDANEAMVLVEERNQANGGANFNEVSKYPLKKLAVGSDELPAGVDPSCKEIHLDSDEFERLFRMKYSEFVTKPQWKQTELKKQHGLF